MNPYNGHINGAIGGQFVYLHLPSEPHTPRLCLAHRPAETAACAAALAVLWAVDWRCEHTRHRVCCLQGWTAVIWAALYGHTAAMQLLVAAKADVNAETNVSSQSAFC